ncbi:MAG: phosphoglycerate mutase (2,3-diphosphoglycerate-independent) [Candidatus Fluviicola riflensis]|nr:MAG: phosphoglycerate mutase (2,3-diphosphoglycerate-independent) [Candidatus Fluviicola riflensis]OGS78496.1 MAG: phosphoglycerate mutase (2,3-diphosphoglycerate-independent) [Candidatus Fluviicola riflensis]OGS85562.1 MAG: phosphoglycerate mutase (2,3-diphosphoglycerate-independent) [Fluviicola sp. RIFCSPHIGHO2_01_FULL_43_53]OGS87603.1 MAG: phosphoglycerate mutase (2,3-diphosphoglycerate-independent) [Fluviicola sp. RIFCSPHIGHO2_12_FULL_43_24]
MSEQKVGLVILDGWGIGDGSSRDAIANAHTPVMDRLMANYPTTALITCGEQVGLPEGQMGNSEVGHLNIGAGRIVYQELTRINKSIRDGEFFEIPVLKKAFESAKISGKKVHFMGLVSNGGVHSSQDHLHALCTMAHNFGLTNVFIHAFTDGRDCDPKSGAGFIMTLEEHLARTTGRIASITGRYYAMDRDNRWERIKVAYDALVRGTGIPFTNAAEAIIGSYTRLITDEFIEAHTLHENGVPVGTIEPGDLVINFNFRTDRPREISLALTQKAFPEYDMHPLSLQYLTMTNYDSSFKKVTAIFEKDNLENTLGEIISKMERTQVRIAETEKYPHVTFFFNGGREKEFKGESRILVNSPKVATYDLQPEMSANEVKNRIIESMEKQTPDFFCLNFANPDMVGHTGVFEAIVKAVETVDTCLGEIVAKAQEKGYELLVIADHGNADVAKNPDGSPNTAHSLNPVPAVLVTNDPNVKLMPGILADVAPTILARMRIASPLEMTGKSLTQVK